MRGLLKRKERKNIDMLFVFLGAPGSGKGTQSKILAKKYQLIHLSTGDILRNEKDSELGKIAQNYIHKGQLVPDDIMIQLVAGKIFSNKDKKIILDGFPRTKIQALGLDELLEKKEIILDKIIYFHIEKKELINRLSGRIINTKTGEIYHIKYHTPPKGVEQKVLIRREDDAPEKITTRLDIYEKETMPVIEYYQKKKILLKIDANKTIDDVHQELVKQLSFG